MIRAMMTIWLMLAPVSAVAETIPEVADFLQQEISNLRDARIPVGENKEASSGDYVLSKFKLRIRAEVGFDAGIADLKVVPGIELGWE